MAAVGADQRRLAVRANRYTVVTRIVLPAAIAGLTLVSYPVSATQPASLAASLSSPDDQGRRSRSRSRDPNNGLPSDVLTHTTLVPCAAGAPPADAGSAMRVATWNIRAARSASLDAIWAELEAMQADVVGLQEVDLRVRRTGFVDQPSALATALGFHYAFAASIKYDGGDYGLAVLSRWPLVEVRRHRLDSSGARELRIVLEVTVCAGGRPLRVFNHHADVREAPRQLGLSELAKMVRPDVGRRVVVMGDFNERPDGSGVRALLGAGLVDALAVHQLDAGASRRVDYLLVDAPLARVMSSTRVWATGNSDHDALLAELQW